MKAKEYIEAKVRFLTAAEGGRKTPCINIAGWQGMEMPLSRVPGQELFHRTPFVEAPQRIELGDSFNGVLWLIWFPEDPYEDYKPGREIEICEGGRVVARQLPAVSVSNDLRVSVSPW